MGKRKSSRPPKEKKQHGEWDKSAKRKTKAASRSPPLQETSAGPAESSQPSRPSGPSSQRPSVTLPRAASPAPSGHRTADPQVQAEAEDELWDIIMWLPPSLVKSIKVFGVETCSDFVGIWTSAEEFLDWARQCGIEGPDAEMDAATRWSKVAARARRHHQQAAAAVMSCRESSYPSAGFAAVMVPKRLPTVRAFRPGDGRAGDALATTISSGGKDAWAKEEAANKAKLDQLFTILWDFVVDHHELGLNGADLQDPLKRDTVKNILLQGACRLSGQRLGALVSSFRRWIRFCQEHNWQPSLPTPFQLAQFLNSVSHGGPTAAASMYAVFKWYHAQGGSQFNVRHPLVSAYRFHAVHHSARQAIELQPWEFINLLLLLEKARGIHKIILALMVMSATSCIRWEHIQRSKFVSTQAGWLEMHCAQGKTRKQGARPAYNWAAPNVVWKGMHLQKILSDFWQHECLTTAGFLIPAIALNAEELWELAETTALVLDKAMSRRRFLELFRGALLTAPRLVVPPTTD